MRKKNILLIALLGTGLVSCNGMTSQVGNNPQGKGIIQALKVTATYTPFQAASPTPRPTLTLTPSPVPSPTQPPCLAQPGQIERKEEVVRDGRPPFVFRVYFPPCFAENQAIRYPVLYMIHGQTYNDEQWERLGIGPAADELIQAKKAPPFLIVMPLERDTFEDIYLAAFSRDVIEGLIPWIDSNYPTCSERACRAIGGLSRGGAWALHLGFTYWELFGAIGMHSTPPFNGDTNHLPIWLRDIPADQLPRIWMDTGQQDAWIRYTTNFEAKLVQYDVPHEWHLLEGKHEESYWSAHVKEYLEWYTQPWNDLQAELISH